MIRRYFTNARRKLIGASGAIERPNAPEDKGQPLKSAHSASYIAAGLADLLILTNQMIRAAKPAPFPNKTHCSNE